MRVHSGCFTGNVLGSLRCDTVGADLKLGLSIDARRYSVAAAILHDLRAGSMRLLTSKPEKPHSQRENGIAVAN
ncbi:hypothetical protein EEB14_55470 [Rhodococcus sp. WS4]|nr:hypothetical protein EEB14_55470 [Rhodococcus sp. WS4]